MADIPEDTDKKEESPERPAWHGPQVDISAEMKTAYLDYAMSVIVSRAIPDLRDGLETRPPPHPFRDARKRKYP